MGRMGQRAGVSWDLSIRLFLPIPPLLRHCFVTLSNVAVEDALVL
jgi:hypothetical protein